MNELSKQPELPTSDTITTTVPVISDSGRILEAISRIATDPAGNLDAMERLLAMYQGLEKDKAERAFNAAMQAVQAEMPRIRRDADNKHTHSTYAKLETVNAALIPVYTQHGFALSFDTGKTDLPDHLLVTCRVSHIGGHSRNYEYPSPITTTGIKGETMMTKTHASGSAMSYGRRYLTLLIFNATMTDEDDDGNSASETLKVIKIGPKRMRKIVDGMLQAVKAEDGPGLLQIVDELENEEQLVVWNELRSWERSSIKTLVTQARAAAGQATDPNYVAPMPDPEFAKQYDEAARE